MNTIINSRKVTVPLSQQQAFEYLSDLNNFKELLPEDKVDNIDCSSDHCHFRVKGLTGIYLKKGNTQPYHLIEIESDQKSQVKFNLHIQIENQNGQSSCQLIFRSDLNPFMKMMVEKPLKNFFDLIAANLEKKFPAN